MSRQLDTIQHRSRTDERAEAQAREHLLLRNYDHRRGYDLEIELVDSAREPALQRRYYLPPGETVSELEIVSTGAFEGQIVMDNDVAQPVECRIGSAPEHTLVVEVGNGALSVTQGLTS